MLKKIRNILFIVILLSTQQASAAINSQNMAGTTLASAGSLGVVMGLATGTAIAISGGLALGVIGAALLISNSVSESSTSSSSAITINLNPKVPLVTPSGWTAGTPASPQPTPPSTQTPVFKYSTSTGIPNQSTYSFNTVLQAAQLFISYNNTYNGQNYTLDTTTATGFTYHGSGAPSQYSYAMSVVCPTGYTASGGNCAVSTPTAVIKPVMGIQQIVRTGNNFAVDPQINPTDKLPTSVLNTTTNSVTVNDSAGNSTTVTLATDGTATITQNKAQVDGTSQQTIVKMSSPNATTGNTEVTGVTQQTVAGTGTLAGTTPVSGGSGPTLDISSLNKEATQQAISTKLSDIKDALNCVDCTVLPDDSEINKQKVLDETAKSTGVFTDAVSDMAGFHNLGWSTWVPSFPSSNCIPYQFSLMGHSITWDYCPYIAKLNELMGWLLALWTAHTISGLFFKKD